MELAGQDSTGMLSHPVYREGATHLDEQIIYAPSCPLPPSIPFPPAVVPLGSEIPVFLARTVFRAGRLLSPCLPCSHTTHRTLCPPVSLPSKSTPVHLPYIRYPHQRFSPHSDPIQAPCAPSSPQSQSRFTSTLQSLCIFCIWVSVHP